MQIILSRGFSEDNGLLGKQTYLPKAIGDHNITAMAGFTSEEYTMKDFQIKQTIPPMIKLSDTTGSNHRRPNYCNINSYSLLSQFTRLNYGYKDKYLLTATIGLMFSRFAEKHSGENFRRQPLLENKQ